MCEASPPISTLPSQMEAGKSLSHLIKEREAEERGKEGKRGMESEIEREREGWRVKERGRVGASPIFLCVGSQKQGDSSAVWQLHRDYSISEAQLLGA